MTEYVARAPGHADVTIRVPPGATIRWWLLGIAWALWAASLVLPTVRWNLFMRWGGWSTGADFHTHVLLRLPYWVVLNLTGGDLAWIPPLDFLWWVPAFASVAFFVFSPLVFLRVRQPTTLFCLRYLGLVMLILPVTLFMPISLRFPRPLSGLWFLAIAHALVLIALWSPWPLVKRDDTRFEVHPTIPTPDEPRCAS